MPVRPLSRKSAEDYVYHTPGPTQKEQVLRLPYPWTYKSRYYVYHTPGPTRAGTSHPGQYPRAGTSHPGQYPRGGTSWYTGSTLEEVPPGTPGMLRGGLEATVTRHAERWPRGHRNRACPSSKGATGQGPSLGPWPSRPSLPGTSRTVLGRYTGTGAVSQPLYLYRTARGLTDLFYLGPRIATTPHGVDVRSSLSVSAAWEVYPGGRVLQGRCTREVGTRGVGTGVWYPGPPTGYLLVLLGPHRVPPGG